jgi:hypothetical protein
MISHQGLRKELVYKKYVIGAHPIIQVFMDRLKVHEIIWSYVRQDKRMKVSVAKTLSVILHNYLTSTLPM